VAGFGQGGSGFGGDDLSGARLPFLYPGIVTENWNPEHPGQLRAQIPGIMDETPWARNRTGGARRWGATDMPPKGASVWIQFVMGDPSQPVWDYGDHAGEGDTAEEFPEAVDPAVSVWGRGPFRVVADTRAGAEVFRLALVKEVDGVEEVIVALEINGPDNSARIYATNALGLSAGGVVDIDCAGDIQIKGRKVMPNGKAIN
jgi:hypothetical protein